MKEILDVIHKTIYQFFDVCGDDEEVPISDKDKLLLEVNKAICNNLKALEQEPFINKPCVSQGACQYHTGMVLDKIKAEIKALTDGTEPEHIWNVDVFDIIDKYRTQESEGRE